MSVSGSRNKSSPPAHILLLNKKTAVYLEPEPIVFFQANYSNSFLIPVVTLPPSFPPRAFSVLFVLAMRAFRLKVVQSLYVRYPAFRG